MVALSVGAAVYAITVVVAMARCGAVGRNRRNGFVVALRGPLGECEAVPVEAAALLGGVFFAKVNVCWLALSLVLRPM